MVTVSLIHAVLIAMFFASLPLVPSRESVIIHIEYLAKTMEVKESTLFIRLERPVLPALLP